MVTEIDYGVEYTSPKTGERTTEWGYTAKEARSVASIKRDQGGVVVTRDETVFAERAAKLGVKLQPGETLSQFERRIVSIEEAAKRLTR